MGIYILLLFIAVISLSFSPKVQTTIGYLLLIICMVMVGLRTEDVGTDTWRYCAYALDSGFEERFGSVYVIMQHLCKSITNSPNAFLTLMSILTYGPLCWVLKKKSPNVLFSALIFIIASAGFFLETFNISREMISASFCLLVVFYFEKDKIKIALFFLIVAFLFHPYAIFIAPFLFVKRIEFKYVYVIVALCVSLIIGLSGILDSIMSILQFFLASLSSDDGVLYQILKYADRDVGSGWNIVGKLAHLLPTIVMVVLTYTSENSQSLFYKFFVIGAVILNIFVDIVYCERIATFFTISEIIAVPLAFYGQTPVRDTRRSYLIILMILTMLLYVYNINFLNGYTYNNTPVPYKSILTN